MIAQAIQALINLIATVISSFFSLLPQTPFNWDYASAIKDFMAPAGYIIPWQAMITHLSVFLIAVATWYIIRWVLRIIKYVS